MQFLQSYRRTATATATAAAAAVAAVTAAAAAESNSNDYIAAAAAAVYADQRSRFRTAEPRCCFFPDSLTSCLLSKNWSEVPSFGIEKSEFQEIVLSKRLCKSEKWKSPSCFPQKDYVPQLLPLALSR